MCGEFAARQQLSIRSIPGREFDKRLGRAAIQDNNNSSSVIRIDLFHFIDVQGIEALAGQFCMRPADTDQRFDFGLQDAILAIDLPWETPPIQRCTLVHADLIAVENGRRTAEGEDKSVQQLEQWSVGDFPDSFRIVERTDQIVAVYLRGIEEQLAVYYAVEFRGRYRSVYEIINHGLAEFAVIVAVCRIRIRPARVTVEQQQIWILYLHMIVECAREIFINFGFTNVESIAPKMRPVIDEANKITLYLSISEVE